MYQSSFSETLDDGSGTARQRERDAIQRSIELMEVAEAAGVPPVLVSMLVTFVVYTILGRWKIHDRIVVSRLRV